MKKVVTFVLLIALCTIAIIPLSSCDMENDSLTVTYVMGDDLENLTESVPYFSVPSLSCPERDGYEFIGWYYDAEYKIKADLSVPLIADTTLYARWQPDIYSLSERVATEILSSSFKIRCDVESEGMSYVGSGVVIYKLSGKAYILTNEHVVKSNIRETDKTYYVIDSTGKKYNATLECADPKYDLALLSVRGISGGITDVSMADSDPSVGDFVISVGNPGGIFNTVTYGNVTMYTEVAKGGEIEVEFDVYWHNAPVYHGSSGGAVYNSALELVGINFAAANEGENGYYTVGGFVQIEKVKEFLIKEGFGNLL